MPVTLTIETFEEFSQRHGGSPILLGNDFVFSDGARASRGDRDRRMEPPEDSYTRLRLQRDYYQTRLRDEEDAFHTFQANCAQQAAWSAKYGPDLPGPPADAVEQLERGKARVEALRSKLTAIEQELEQTPQAQAQRDLRAGERGHQAEMDREIARIRSVTI